MSYKKYRNIHTKIDGITFPSIMESRRYLELKILQKAGEIRYFIRQPKFDLPGGVTYSGDFLIVWKDGSVTIEDVKGTITKTFIKNKKMVEAIYPVEIIVVKKVR